jgi:hypothetical protein
MHTTKVEMKMDRDSQVLYEGAAVSRMENIRAENLFYARIFVNNLCTI